MSSISLVSTYVVCERLSVKHKLAGVVENLVQKSQFTLFSDLVPRIPPPPRKLKFRQILAFQDFSPLTCGEYPPPPPPPEHWNLGRSWHFKTFHLWLVENTPPPPNWNLGRSWHFKTFHFSLVENMTFEFWLAQNTTPPANWVPRRYVETNICIPRGYRLVRSIP